MKLNKPRIIGITGNSGSGKTHISNMMKKYDSYVIFCDEVAHEVLEKNMACFSEIVGFFGKEILSEEFTIDRKKLGKIVFADRGKLDILTEITHKYIMRDVEKKINEAVFTGNNYKYIVVDAPVLVNTPLVKIVDEIWVVYSEYTLLIDRIKKRDNLSDGDAENRISSQMTFEELKKHADFLIDNSQEDDYELEIKISEYLKAKS